MQKVILGALFCVAISHALPYLVEDEDGQQYYLTPVLNRQRRDNAQIYGQGGANGKTQGGYVGIQNPNGSGGQVGYGHRNGGGHDVSVGGSVPVWSNKNRYGESTVNVGAGFDRHYGGYGTGPANKRGSINFNHRF